MGGKGRKRVGLIQEAGGLVRKEDWAKGKKGNFLNPGFPALS